MCMRVSVTEGRINKDRQTDIKTSTGRQGGGGGGGANPGRSTYLDFFKMLKYFVTRSVSF